MHLEALSDAIHLPLRKSRRHVSGDWLCTRTWTGLDDSGTAWRIAQGLAHGL